MPIDWDKVFVTNNRRLKEISITFDASLGLVPIGSNNLLRLNPATYGTDAEGRPIAYQGGENGTAPLRLPKRP